MLILNEKQIKQKAKRLAYQILENNWREKELTLVGINNNGVEFAHMLMEELLQIREIELTISRVSLNPAEPLSQDIILEMPAAQIENKVIILVDDVANTGRTIFYATKPFLEILPRKLEVAVLVDRKHKSFPILVNYIGLSLATTAKENITVKIRDIKEQAVFLD